MSFTLVGIGGRAKHGKDLTASYLCDQFGFITRSFSDPMKEFLQKAFGFTNLQLWGPSEMRGEVVGADDVDFWSKALMNFERYAPQFARSMPLLPHEKRAFDLVLRKWYAELVVTHTKAGTPGTITPRVALQTLGTECGRQFDMDLWVRYCYEKIVSPLRERSIPGVVIPDHRFLNEILATKRQGGFVMRVRRPGLVSQQVGIQGHPSEIEQESIPDSAYDLVLNMPEGIDAAAAYLKTICDQKPWEKA